MSFKDYEHFADNLTLPILGTKYVIPEMSARMGARLQMLVAQQKERQDVAQKNLEAFEKAKKAGEEIPEPEPLPEVDDEPTHRELLGDVIDEMYEDDVPAGAIDVAAQTAYYNFIAGREVAEVFWNSGGDPKALEDHVKARMNSITNGVEENTTQKRASTSGTKSKTKNSRSTTAEAKKSGTRKSSKSGDSSKEPSKENSA